MKKLALLFGLLLGLCGQISAQFNISSVTVTPPASFYKSGDVVNISFVVPSHNWTSPGGSNGTTIIVLSKDATISNDDYVLKISGGVLTADVFANIASTNVPNLNITSEYTSSSTTYSYSFTVPNGVIADGEYNVIVPQVQQSTKTYSAFRDKTGASAKIEISSSKHVLENTAWAGEKSSKAVLIVSSSQKLKITATPGDTTFKGGNFPTVELKALANNADVTNSGNVVIKYTILDAGGKELVSNQIYNSSNKIPLNKSYFANGSSIKIQAQATSSSSDFESSEQEEWTYTQSLPKLNIEVANYDINGIMKNGVILFDTKVFGTGSSDIGIPENGNIKFKITDEDGKPFNGTYTIYYTLDGKNPTTSSTLYNDKTGVEIGSSVTLKVIVSAEYYSSGSLDLTFVQELKGAWINLILQPQGKTAKENEPTKFGAKQAFQIQYDPSDGQLLKYSIDKRPWTAEELQKNGKNGDAVKIDTVANNWGLNVGDTIYVSAYAYNGKYDPSYKVWKFVQERLPNVALTPSEKSPKEYKFTSAFQATAEVKINPKDYLNFEIWYTTDASEPSPTNPAAKKIDNYGKISIDQTTIIKITAFSDDRLPSVTQEYRYRLTADAKAAWFYDTKGKGAIDKVVIYTTIAVNNLPDNVKLVSPWDVGSKNSGGINVWDTVIVNKDGTMRYPDGATGTCKVELNGANMIVVTADKWIFPPCGKTGFDPKPSRLGKLSGIDYSDTGYVWIGDSIAPVPVDTAFYYPGKLNEALYYSTKKKERYNDTLRVKFSEQIDFVSSDTIIFKFSGGYDLGLKLIDNEKGVAKFEVIKKINGDPSDGDSLSVLPYKISDLNGVSQTSETCYVPMRVAPTPYLLITTPVSPMSAGKEQVVVVANFLMKIPAAEINNVNVSGKIIDATGNLVTQFSGLSKNKATGAYAEITDKGDGDHKILVMWDGKNRAGRNVGSGAYLVILNITGPDEVTNGAAVTIGVRSQSDK